MTDYFLQVSKKAAENYLEQPEVKYLVNELEFHIKKAEKEKKFSAHYAKALGLLHKYAEKLTCIG